LSDTAIKETGPQVILQKIYLKDCSVEVPGAPMIFTKEWKPRMDVQINTDVQHVADQTHQVSLSVTVTAKLDDATAYLVEVQQAGIFVLQGFDDKHDRRPVLGAYCPNLLFPYAREVVSDVVQRAGFPQFLLQPVNFDALFQEYVKQQQSDGERSH
jgi:preprotein translocase subunit SecB